MTAQSTKLTAEEHAACETVERLLRDVGVGGVTLLTTIPGEIMMRLRSERRYPTSVIGSGLANTIERARAAGIAP